MFCSRNRHASSQEAAARAAAAATCINHDALSHHRRCPSSKRRRAAFEHFGLCGKHQAAIAGNSVRQIRAGGKELTANTLRNHVSGRLTLPARVFEKAMIASYGRAGECRMSTRACFAAYASPPIHPPTPVCICSWVLSCLGLKY